VGLGPSNGRAKVEAVYNARTWSASVAANDMDCRSLPVARAARISRKRKRRRYLLRRSRL